MRKKYPWIPKPYYAAVMFACKIIRENGYFNQAVHTTAKYYKVDEGELKKYIRARQGAGQRGQSRKYFYFGISWLDTGIIDPRDVAYSAAHELQTVDEFKALLRFDVFKATSVGNAERQLRKKKSEYAYIVLIEPMAAKKTACPWTLEQQVKAFEKRANIHLKTEGELREIQESRKVKELQKELPAYKDGKWPDINLDFSKLDAIGK